MPDSNLFEELFCFNLDIFQEGGGLPDSKLFEECVCLRLDIFQERGGSYLNPKMLRNVVLLWLGHFPRKIGEDDQNPKV